MLLGLGLVSTAMTGTTWRSVVTTGRDVEGGARRRHGATTRRSEGVQITSYNNIISYNNKCLDNAIDTINITSYNNISVYTKNFSGIHSLSRDDQRRRRFFIVIFFPFLFGAE